MPTPPFHLAFAVDDLSTTRTFYGELLACPIGREDPRWIDFDFWGHQITAHLAPRAAESTPTNQVDGEAVPASHFGAILPWDEWEALAERLRGAGVRFLIAPQIRFQGGPGEQATFFIKDPSGNALEFKSFRESRMIFARE